jgi:hypothetical protein
MHTLAIQNILWICETLLICKLEQEITNYENGTRNTVYLPPKNYFRLKRNPKTK